ncbi:MAG: hypothetical protein J5545_04560 [Bacteroidaceae bacterium]|nr:hypothetical protein [Bacteroidaceae bacterium]
MNLPKEYKDYLLRHWKQEDVEVLVRGLEAPPTVSIRLNPNRLPPSAEPTGADGRVPWCPEGIYLKERPAFTADPLLHAGAYYVQEASSMFLAHVLRQLLFQDSPSIERLFEPSAGCKFQVENALDLCAAPGGKSTLLRSLLPDGCLLVANEPIRNRAQVLAENLAKWGHPNILVTQAKAAEIANFIKQKGTAFDLILTDVPCSGEGMFRKEPEAVRQWSPAFVAECAALQRSIVQDIWPALRPGGYLIYSTCTFNPEEDEQNVEWIAHELGATVLPVPTDPTWNIRGDLRTTTSPVPCYHFLPGLVRGEGFFLALLQKDDSSKTHQKLIKNSKNALSIGSFSTTHQKLIKNSSKATKNAHSIETFSTLPTNLLDEPGVPQVELSLPDAVRYLQRESLVLPSETPRGHVQVCFLGQRLGLMNNLGSRANNLYPKEWRIRSGHIEAATLFPTE